MTRFTLLIALILIALPLFAQYPAARAARCPECFPGGPVFTPYPTQVRPPAYYGGFGGFAPVLYGGFGYRAAGVWTGVAATAAGVGIAVMVDEIQQRRAEAAEARRDRRDRQQQGVVQLRNCRVYEATEKNAPPLMVCEDPNGTKIVMERER